ncbi:MAG: M1 family aminopeptidase, partial [Candidatus Aminicenantes bacterium]
ASFLYPQTESGSLENFMDRFVRSLEGQRLSEYVNHYTFGLREKESASIISMFEDFDMETVSADIMSLKQTGDNNAVVHIRAAFQNFFSVIMEVWKLELFLSEKGWAVITKQSIGNPQKMYSISIPSSRAERVRGVIIQHADIRIYFEDALVFYDNIPEIDTALLVLGKGEVDFEPSLQRERHQLDLIYGNPFLREELEYAYIRGNDSFFAKNINIIPYDDTGPPSVSEKDWKRVSTLFSRHYPRSFTVESPWVDSLMTVLPQGDEAVFEFETKKKGVFTYINSPFSDEEISLYEWKESRLICLYSPPIEEGKKRLFISHVQKYDVKDIRLKLIYRPEDYLFSGNAEIRLESSVGRLGVVKFKFNPDLQVLRILDEDENDLYYTWDRLRKTIYVYFLSEVPRGSTARLQVYYRGNIPPPPVTANVIGTGGIQNIDNFPVEFRTYLYSRRAYWYPSPPDDDYFTAGLTISLPKGFDVISSGLRSSDVSGRRDGGNTESEFVTTRFESQKPLKYLSFIVGRFREVFRKDQPRSMVYFQSSRARPDQWNVLEEAGKIISFYESKFGEYPYQKFTLLKRVWASGGGHSPPGYIVINELPQGSRFRFRLQSRSPVDFSQWPEYFLAHELAHQWWGQGVSWKTYRDIWLSEGLSQFSASLYLLEKYGPGAFSRITKKFSSWTEKKSKWGGITMGSRISHFDFDAYQAIVYNKAALVLHMLKDYIGEELFFAGIQKFFSRNEFSVAGTADFRGIFHNVSGVDLDDFFHCWFENHELPKVEVRKFIQEAEEGYRLRLDVNQTGDSCFIFPLWVEWEERRQKIRKKILVNKTREQYIFQLKEKPRRIKINPDRAVPGDFRIR